MQYSVTPHPHSPANCEYWELESLFDGPVARSIAGLEKNGKTKVKSQVYNGLVVLYLPWCNGEAYELITQWL